jgi:hypothetical protein
LELFTIKTQGHIYYSQKRYYYFLIIFLPPFLGKFGPLGETYDESEALGEPLALDLRTAEE